jgi:DNA polymerase-4
VAFILDKALKLSWLYLDLNSYFATIEQQLNPESRNKPIVVLPVMTDATCAIAASYEAKAKGIRTGTKIYEAKRLCPELICVEASHTKYIDYHHRILNEVEKLLHIDHVFSIDECACKLTGDLTKEANALAIAQKIKDAIRSNVGDYIDCSIGIAPNRFLAKIATDMQKPDGLVVINPVDLPHKLYSLKLRDIPGIGHKVFQRLVASNISSIEALYAADKRQLRAIWGSIAGEKCWYLLRGVDFPHLESAQRSISHSKILSPEGRTPQLAREVALKLLLKATQRLRADRLFATGLGIYFSTLERKSYKEYCRIPSSNDSALFSRLMLVKWDQMISNNSVTAIRKIVIVLS